MIVRKYGEKHMLFGFSEKTKREDERGNNLFNVSFTEMENVIFYSFHLYPLILNNGIIQSYL